MVEKEACVMQLCEGLSCSKDTIIVLGILKWV